MRGGCRMAVRGGVLFHYLCFIYCVLLYNLMSTRCKHTTSTVEERCAYCDYYAVILWTVGQSTVYDLCSTLCKLCNKRYHFIIFNWLFLPLWFIYNKNTLMLLTSNFLMSVFSNDVNVFAASIRQFVSIWCVFAAAGILCWYVTDSEHDITHDITLLLTQELWPVQCHQASAMVTMSCVSHDRWDSSPQTNIKWWLVSCWNFSSWQR